MDHFNKITIGVLGAAVLGLGSLGAIVTQNEKQETKPTPNPSSQPSSESKTYDAGIYRVGEDIQPGIYRTAGPKEDDPWIFCYWARLSGATGKFENIIANGSLDGPGYLRVQATDSYVEFGYGCKWRADA